MVKVEREGRLAKESRRQRTGSLSPNYHPPSLRFQPPLLNDRPRLARGHLVAILVVLVPVSKVSQPALEHLVLPPAPTLYLNTPVLPQQASPSLYNDAAPHPRFAPL